MIVLLLNDLLSLQILNPRKRVVNIHMVPIAISAHSTKQMFRNEELWIITL